ncbi:MAG: hypothetical protein V1772_09660 [Chloroflexota bacterium]
MEIAYEGRLAWRDCVRACWQHYRPSPNVLILRLVVLALAAAAPLYVAAEGGPLAAVLPIALFGAALTTAPWWQAQWAARQVWLRVYALGPLQTGVADPDGLHPTGADPIPWSAYRGHLAGPQMVLLYATRQHFSAMVRGLFRGEADWQAFVELARAHVAPRPPSRRERVWVPILLLMAMVLAAMVVIALRPPA